MEVDELEEEAMEVNIPSWEQQERCGRVENSCGETKESLLSEEGAVTVPVNVPSVGFAPGARGGVSHHPPFLYTG